MHNVFSTLACMHTLLDWIRIRHMDKSMSSLHIFFVFGLGLQNVKHPHAQSQIHKF